MNSVGNGATRIRCCLLGFDRIFFTFPSFTFLSRFLHGFITSVSRLGLVGWQVRRSGLSAVAVATGRPEEEQAWRLQSSPSGSRPAVEGAARVCP